MRACRSRQGPSGRKEEGQEARVSHGVSRSGPRSGSRFPRSPRGTRSTGEFPAGACATPGTARLRILKGQTRALMLLPRPLHSRARVREGCPGPPGGGEQRESRSLVGGSTGKAKLRDAPTQRWVRGRSHPLTLCSGSPPPNLSSQATGPGQALTSAEVHHGVPPLWAWVPEPGGREQTFLLFPKRETERLPYLPAL